LYINQFRLKEAKEEAGDREEKRDRETKEPEGTEEVGNAGQSVFECPLER